METTAFACNISGCNSLERESLFSVQMFEKKATATQRAAVALNVTSRPSEGIHKPRQLKTSPATFVPPCSGRNRAC